MWGVDLLKVKFAKEEIFIIEIKKMQLAGDKESPLLKQGVNLCQVDLSGEHCTWSTNYLVLNSCGLIITAAAAVKVVVVIVAVTYISRSR